MIDGIKITEKEMKSIFQKHSIKIIEVAIGDTLDPNYHQVMCEVDDSDVEQGKHYDDAVVHNAWFLIDIHNPSGGGWF